MKLEHGVIMFGAGITLAITLYFMLLLSGCGHATIMPDPRIGKNIGQIDPDNGKVWTTQDCKECE